MDRLPSLNELAVELIDIESTTGSEAAMADRTIVLLEGLGFEARRQSVADGRDNVVATTELPPQVLLNTHLDTVPPFFSSSEDKQYIYGRGSCDTKGILAAMLKAADELLRSGERRFGFLLVVGEETDHVGAMRAEEELELDSVRHVIVGEPTENRFASGQKGALRCTLHASGRAAHSAYPELGESAIETLLDVLQDVRAADWGMHPTRGETTVNIGTLAGGKRANIIPDQASADLMFRIATDLSEVESRLRSLADGRVRVDVLSSNEPQDLFVPEGHEGTVVAFNTDVPWLRRFGQASLVGPGSILDAHGARERIDKEQLRESVALYRDTVRALVV